MKILRLVSVGFVLAIFSVTLLAAPVSAHSGHDHPESSSDHGNPPQSREDLLRVRGSELLTEARSNGQIKAKDAVMAACKNRKQSLEAKMAKIVDRAKNHQTRLDSVLAKLVDYHHRENLNVPDWDNNLTTTQTLKTESQNSLGALQKLVPTLDCSRENIAGDIATFKAATTQSRSDLIAYKQALKSLLTSVKESQD